MFFLICAAAGALAAGTASSAYHSPSQEMIMQDEKIAVVQRQIDAWNRRDWAAAGAMFAEDGVLHSMMIEPIVGKAAITERIAGLGAGIDQIELDVRNIGRIGDVVVVERVDRFTYNGHTGSVPVVGILEVEDGRIKAWREYYDRASLVREMGLSDDFHKSED
jgi:limonene-1,2-epoxide hydrolase